MEKPLKEFRAILEEDGSQYTDEEIAKLWNIYVYAGKRFYEYAEQKYG